MRTIVRFTSLCDECHASVEVTIAVDRDAPVRHWFTGDQCPDLKCHGTLAIQHLTTAATQ